MLTTGLVMLNVEAFWQFIVVGVVVIVAVLIDQSRDLIIGRGQRRAADMTEPVLSVRNLTKRFGGLTAVNDVSWDVYPGEVVALLGDNGAGKSTLIKCISGVYQRRRGRDLLRRQARAASPARSTRAAQGIETIYQDLALANNLDVARQHLPRPRGEEPLSRRARSRRSTRRTMLQRVARPRSTRSTSTSPP